MYCKIVRLDKYSIGLDTAIKESADPRYIEWIYEVGIVSFYLKRVDPAMVYDVLLEVVILR